MQESIQNNSYQSIMKKSREYLSPVVTRTVLERKLMDRIMQLEATVETMNEKVVSLENQVESLETQVKDLTPLKKEVEQLKDVKAICSNINNTLLKEIEKMQQYSRRNCIVLEGIPVKPRESISDLEKVVKSTIKTEFKLEEKDIAAEFDKTHRIGGITKNRQQRIIVRFKSHGFCEKIYNRRKETKPVNVKPSLTKFRLGTLKKAKDRYANSDDVDFIYSDILGNLKIRLKNQLDGRFVHSFYDMDELSQIIFDSDYNSYEL